MSNLTNDYARVLRTTREQFHVALTAHPRVLSHTVNVVSDRTIRVAFVGDVSKGALFDYLNEWRPSACEVTLVRGDRWHLYKDRE